MVEELRIRWRTPGVVADIPTLAGVPVPGDDRLVAVWCVHCRCHHTHGRAPGETEVGHRVAHCHTEESPYRDAGYFIVIGETE